CPNATHQQPKPCFLRHLPSEHRSCPLNLPCRRIGLWKGRVVESMNPVTRALQTIAAIESETRKLSASSLASSSGPTALSANSKATADLNRDSGAPPIAQVKATTPEAAFAWDREIRIDERDRVAVAPGRDVTRSAITIITGVLSLALALFLGWV